MMWQIDPNDPQNSHLLEVLHSSKEAGNDLQLDPLKYSMFLGKSLELLLRHLATLVLSHDYALDREAFAVCDKK